MPSWWSAPIEPTTPAPPATSSGVPDQLPVIHLAVLRAALEGRSRAELAAIADVPELAVPTLLRVALAKLGRVLDSLE